jgi:hypothetical protein
MKIQTPEGFSGASYEHARYTADENGVMTVDVPAHAQHFLTHPAYGGSFTPYIPPAEPVVPAAPAPAVSAAPAGAHFDASGAGDTAGDGDGAGEAAGEGGAGDGGETPNTGGRKAKAKT